MKLTLGKKKKKVGAGIGYGDCFCITLYNTSSV